MSGQSPKFPNLVYLHVRACCFQKIEENTHVSVIERTFCYLIPLSRSELSDRLKFIWSLNQIVRLCSMSTTSPQNFGLLWKSVWQPRGTKVQKSANYIIPEFSVSPRSILTKLSKNLEEDFGKKDEHKVVSSQISKLRNIWIRVL